MNKSVLRCRVNVKVILHHSRDKLGELQVNRIISKLNQTFLSILFTVLKYKRRSSHFVRRGGGVECHMVARKGLQRGVASPVRNVGILESEMLLKILQLLMQSRIVFDYLYVAQHINVIYFCTVLHDICNRSSIPVIILKGNDHPAPSFPPPLGRYIPGCAPVNGNETLQARFRATTCMRVIETMEHIILDGSFDNLQYMIFTL